MMKTIVLLSFLLSFLDVHAQSYTQLTDLPTIYIETNDGNDVIDKENYVISKVVFVDRDIINTYEDTQIRGRGNSSWYALKKPYRLKFAKKQSLLGPDFAKAKSWTLLANHADKTMIRNALTYDLGKFLGISFCPASKFVDLYLNGTYRGTYQISDQVQVNKNRVEVDEVTGWLLELTDEIHKDLPYIVTDRNFYINIKNPDDENLTEACQQEILDWCNQLSNVIWSDDYTNPSTGYCSMIDEKSFIDWYIATELTGNVDGFNSIYVYKDYNDQHLHFGPLWDEDLGYNNSNERNWETSLLAYTDNDNRQLSETMRHIWKDAWFAQAVNSRWKELLDDGLQQYLLDKIDSLRNVIYLSQTENFKIWSINESIYGFERQVFHDNYDDYIDDLKSFINGHIAYMTTRFHDLLLSSDIAHISKKSSTDVIYHLTGQRVGTVRNRGIYVKKGKKVIY